MARTRITEIDGDEVAEEKEEAPFPEHPLFPLEDGDKTFEVSFIQITRVESGVQKFGPTVPSNELNTEDDIFNRWGGGHYVLIARAATRGTGYPGRFKKHRRVNIPGTPKPLSPDPTPEEQKLAAPQTGVAQASPMGGGDPMSFFAMMMQMQQQSLERERQASEKAVAQNQQFMQMFMTVMQGSKADSQNMIQMMMQMSSQSQQGMLQFISAMMANRGGGPEEMAKYADLLKTLGVGGGDKKGGNGEGGAAASESIGAMLENAADLVQGMVALKGAASPTQIGATADPNAPPMGGAASLLKGMMR